MFVLSEGMPKSGSTLFSYYQKEIITDTFTENGQKQFEKLISDGIIKGIGHFVHGTEDSEQLGFLYSLSEEIGPFVVKAHSRPDERMFGFLREHQVLVTYIHRDPRDVILSLIDHGKRPPKHANQAQTFSQHDSVVKAIPLVIEFCRNGSLWLDSGLCQVFRYHDLLTDPGNELKRFYQMIQQPFNSHRSVEIIKKFTENQIQGQRQFNTGKLTRYAEEMTPSEVDMCNKELSREINYFKYKCM